MHNTKINFSLCVAYWRWSWETGTGNRATGHWKDILARNTSDDNAALMKLAERIVQQQDAAVARPNAIRASVPEQGNVLVFRRAVLVDPWAPLDLKIEAQTTRPAAFAVRFLVLVGIAALFGLFMLVAFRPRQTTHGA